MDFPSLPDVKNSIGMADTDIRTRLATAAWPKNASSAVDHIEVASVVKPIGESINVAGNSFMHSRKTRAAPDSMPGLMIGRVIEKKA